MRCETTFRGVTCNESATYKVEGRIIKPHFTCDRHAKMWKDKCNNLFGDNLILIPLHEVSEEKCK